MGPLTCATNDIVNVQSTGVKMIVLLEYFVSDC